MLPQPAKPTEIHDLPSPRANAFMDIGESRSRSRRGNINMNNRKQVRKDRATMATLSEQLVALEQMTVGELAEKFREVFGFPTRTRNKSYLRKRLSWQIQALAEGGPVAARPRQNRGAGTAGSGSVAARAGIRRCARRWRAHPGTTTRFAPPGHRLDRRAGSPRRRAPGHRPR